MPEFHIEEEIAALMDNIKTGAALLDQKQPNWFRRVNPERLRMQSPCDCVLGQLHGTYPDGLKEVLPDAAYLGALTYRHGFNFTEALRDALFEEPLHIQQRMDVAWNAEWRRQIRVRRLSAEAIQE